MPLNTASSVMRQPIVASSMDGSSLMSSKFHRPSSLRRWTSTRRMSGSISTYSRSDSMRRWIANFSNTSPRQNSLRPACVSSHASYSSSDRPCSGRPISVVLVVIAKPWRLCRRVPRMRIAGRLVRVRSRRRCATKAAPDLSRLFDGGRGRLCRHAAPPHFHNHPARASGSPPECPVACAAGAPWPPPFLDARATSTHRSARSWCCVRRRAICARRHAPAGR